MRLLALPGGDRSLSLILLLITSLQHLAGNQAPAAVTGVNGGSEKRCVLAGHVVNGITGEPLRKAALTLVPAGGGSMWTFTNSPDGGVATSRAGYSATSENDGSFQFENVAAGHYHLSGSRFGFLSARYTGASMAKSVAVITLVPGQQISGLVVPFTPHAVISGRVLDEDGDPLIGNMVQIIKQSWSRGKRQYAPEASCQTDDRGDYRCANLAPGRYYVAATQMNFGPANDGSLQLTGKPKPQPIPTYYPSSPTLSTATPIEITAGQDAPGIAIRVLSSQTFHVRGKVSGIQGPSFVILASRAGVTALSIGGRSPDIKPDGTFDIPGVSPGAYIASVFSMAGDEPTTSGHLDVDVSTSDVNDVAIVVVPPSSLKGHVLVEGTPPSNGDRFDPSMARISLNPADESVFQGPIPFTQAKADSNFVLSALSPGQYVPAASPVPSTYVRSIQYGKAEVLGSLLNLSGGASDELLVVYRYGAAEVSGSPKKIDDRHDLTGNSEAKILLVPEALKGDGSGMQFAETDGEGKFRIASLAPGKYKIFAFEQVDFEQIQDPDLLALISDKGVTIDLKEGEKRQVEPALIPFSDWNQILLRAGLTQ